MTLEHFYPLLSHLTNFFYLSITSNVIILLHRLWKSASIIDHSKEKGHTDGQVDSIVYGDNIDDVLVICSCCGLNGSCYKHIVQTILPWSRSLLLNFEILNIPSPPPPQLVRTPPLSIKHSKLWSRLNSMWKNRFKLKGYRNWEFINIFWGFLVITFKQKVLWIRLRQFQNFNLTKFHPH